MSTSTKGMNTFGDNAVPASLLADAHGQQVLTALSRFIQHIVQSSTGIIEPVCTNHKRDSAVSDEMQSPDLLGALGSFIRATVMPELPVLRTENTSIESEETLQADIVLYNRKLASISGLCQDFDSITRDIREHVFNNMPIMLLQFDNSGRGARLVTRNEAIKHIMDFKSDEVDALVSKSNIGHYGSYSEQDKNILKASLSRYFFRRARYAILSHTWIRDTPGDVVLSDWKKRKSNPRGFQKITEFCKIAARDHGVTLGWMDTVCINKDSSSELDESIRSMYRWYQNARICVAYLSETDHVNEMQNDSWFTRGWTLQELLAPKAIEFYNKHWKKLKELYQPDMTLVELPMLPPIAEEYIVQEIQEITSITAEEFSLCRSGETQKVPISRKMQLAARRSVTRAEDAVYSLMGLLGVEISIAYGEGQHRALYRLIRELLNTQRNVLDVFNFLPGGEGLIPANLNAYQHRTYVFDNTGNETPSLLDQWPLLEPIMVTHLGVRISLLLVPGIQRYGGGPAPYPPYGDYWGSVDAPAFGIESTTRQFDLLSSCIYTDDMVTTRSKNVYWGSSFVITFGIVNFGTEDECILLPETCLSVPLDCGVKPVLTVGPSDQICICSYDGPIVFQLQSFYNSNGVPKDDLSKHGMQLVTLYL